MSRIDERTERNGWLFAHLPRVREGTCPTRLPQAEDIAHLAG